MIWNQRLFIANARNAVIFRVGGVIGWDDGATRTNTNAKMVTEKITHINK